MGPIENESGFATSEDTRLETPICILSGEQRTNLVHGPTDTGA